MGHSTRSLRIAPDKLGIVKIAFQRTGLSQEALATETSFSKSTIKNFLRGVPVDRSCFIDINKFLGFDDWQDIAGLRPPIPPSNLERSGAIHFVGRGQLMETLYQLLAREGRIAITAIAGMAGVGKTELALQYGHRHLREKTYPGGICWFRVRSEDPDAPGLGMQIINFAQKHLGLTVPKKSGEDLWSLREQTDWCWRNWQPTDKQVLIILDDVPSYESIEPFLPNDDARFRVLITTRVQALGGDIQDISIEPLQLEAALELLKSFVGEDRIKAEIEEAKALCQWLGCLPLGLELVGRYLKLKKGLSLAEMHQRLENARLEQTSVRLRVAGMTAQRNLIAAFELSWRELDELSQQLACLLSIFAAVPIPWTLVEQCLIEYNLEKIEDSRDYKLVNLSLLKQADEHTNLYSLHQLTREFFRAKSEELEWLDSLREIYCSGIARKGKEFYTSLTPNELLRFKSAIPHIEEVTENLYFSCSDEAIHNPFCALGVYYNSQGVYQIAESWLEKGLAITKERLGENHTNIGTILQNLAESYRLQGRYKEAETYSEKGFDTLTKQFPDNPLIAALRANNLAVIYMQQGQYKEAESICIQSLSLLVDYIGFQHPFVATCINNLAEAFKYQGLYNQAIPLYEKALEIREALLGDQHPDVAESLNNLAQLYEKSEHYHKAESHYKKALELRKDLLGEQHPDVGITLNNLASLYNSEQRFSESEPLLIEALAIYSKSFGTQHPEVATSLINLAQVYTEQKRFQDAEESYSQALRICIQLLGENHPLSAEALKHFADLYRHQQRYSEAEILLRKSLEIAFKIFGEEHSGYVENLIALATIHVCQCHFGKAKYLYKKAFELNELLLGKNHPDTLLVKQFLEAVREKRKGLKYKNSG